MKLTMLGTGNAGVTEYYNTCFVISNTVGHDYLSSSVAGRTSDPASRHFLVDTGGGNGILRQLKKTGISLDSIKDIFITHRHTDHILGIIWIMRLFSKSARWEDDFGKVRVYGNQDTIELIGKLKEDFFSAKEQLGIDQGIELIQIHDGETRSIIGQDVTFFDIHSAKADQFGFRMALPGGETLVCLGDEPYNDICRPYVAGCTWLMHEAFCLHSQAEEYRPYQKHHSTVKDACGNAEALGARNLILYHTEEQTIGHRRELYSAEGTQYFSGNLYVPEDLEVIELQGRSRR